MPYFVVFLTRKYLIAKQFTALLLDLSQVDSYLIYNKTKTGEYKLAPSGISQCSMLCYRNTINKFNKINYISYQVFVIIYVAWMWKVIQQTMLKLNKLFNMMVNAHHLYR